MARLVPSQRIRCSCRSLYGSLPTLADSVYDVIVNDGRLRSKVHLAPVLAKRLFHRQALLTYDIVEVKSWQVRPQSFSASPPAFFSFECADSAWKPQ